MSMETRDTPFKVRPLTAELNPNEELDLEVSNPSHHQQVRCYLSPQQYACQILELGVLRTRKDGRSDDAMGMQ